MRFAHTRGWMEGKYDSYRVSIILAVRMQLYHNITTNSRDTNTKTKGK